MTEEETTMGGIRIDLESGSTGNFAGVSAAHGKIIPIPNDNPNIETIKDLALSDITLEDFPVVKEWRQMLFQDEGIPEVCDELPRLLTEYLRKHEGTGISDYLLRARSLHHVFTNKTPIVRKTDLLPGQTTRNFVAPVIYPDTIGLGLWPELNTMGERKQNPFKIKKEVAKRLNKEIFPFWMFRNVQEVARYSDYDTDDLANPHPDPIDGGKLADGTPSIDPPLKKTAGQTPKCQELMERIAFYLSDKATCVSHTAPDFGRVLKYGLKSLSEQMKADMTAGKAASGKEKEFLEGVILTFEGAVIYATHLADEAGRVGNTDLERICRKVPAEPAETLHEALASIWICYHLLLQENTNFGFSIGLLDQLLNPYYLADYRKLDDAESRDAYVRKAIELTCHFFLHCSDHVPVSTEVSETLFAGSGSNQALTLGGTRVENGQVVDAVNDMTYIILKATEILAIRDPNVHVRYHKDIHHRDGQGKCLGKDQVSSYLKRICQVNILTRATPAIHGDVPVTQSMARYYAAHDGIDEETARADAHDYTSIGCIEENAAGKHYGNTGSTLLVLPAVLELAMFGGKHRSLGIDEDAPNLFSGGQEHTTRPLHQMESMDEFIQAFRTQLDHMAFHTVQANNYYGRTMEKMRQAPFLSGIFVGPTSTPDSNHATYRDVSSGGARYNSAGVAVIGLADVIDSFCVIDSLVFGGKMSAEELLAAMASDFVAGNGAESSVGFLAVLKTVSRWLTSSPESAPAMQLGEERLREIVREIKLAPKYGKGIDTRAGIYNNDLAVKYTHLVTKILQDTFYRYRTHRGGRYLCGYWSMTNHAGFGMLAKATPNGRRKGRAFASGITPTGGLIKGQGEKVSLLDHISSVASVDANTVQNGYTYNLSLTTRGQAHLEEDTTLFANYIKAFEDQNGVLVQLCVSSIEDLVAADMAATNAMGATPGSAEMEALAPFKDLMIRVAGYSAYFVTLSPEMRREIIARSNFSLDKGEEQHELPVI